ncbi:MAG: disulfide bond formation protein B [Candidatus Pelagibacter sp.]|tara:strand:- start:594 stop:1082 length:489 start_codon:yes stop_codon:yes gene_type:complete
MHFLKIEFCLKLIFLICFISIISAYFIEYILGHQPCNLCIIERIPYGIGMFLIVSNYIFKKNEKFIIILLLLTFFFSFFISIYHFGIEQNFFDESSVCNLKNSSDIITKEELLRLLNEKNVSCKDVTFRVFGLSLTSINILISILINILLIKTYTNYEKIRH